MFFFKVPSDVYWAQLEPLRAPSKRAWGKVSFVRLNLHYARFNCISCQRHLGIMALKREIAIIFRRLQHNGGT